MPLKLSLRPRERVIIGTALVQNCGSKCELLVENQVPILRGRHVLTESGATSPCRRVYFALQLMYLEGAPNLDLQEEALSLIRQVGEAAPSTIPLLTKICDELLAGRAYAALLLAQQLIQFEDDLFAARGKTKEGA
jgi:flagellar protein FlbT